MYSKKGYLIKKNNHKLLFYYSENYVIIKVGGVSKMRKFLTLFILSLTTIILIACNNQNVVSESVLENFVTGYKKEIYNVDLQNEMEDSVIVANVKPFVGDELFNRNKKNGIYVLPKYFASENEVNIRLEKTKIDSFKQNDSNIEVKYTLTLKIGNEEFEKQGIMTITGDDKEHFIINNDHETPIMVNGQKLM